MCFQPGVVHGAGHRTEGGTQGRAAGSADGGNGTREAHAAGRDGHGRRKEASRKKGERRKGTPGGGCLQLQGKALGRAGSLRHRRRGSCYPPQSSHCPRHGLRQCRQYDFDVSQRKNPPCEFSYCFRLQNYVFPLTWARKGGKD